MDLTKLIAKDRRFVIGLTSGASCCGLKAVLARLKGTGPTLGAKIILAKQYPYTPGLRTRLLAPRIHGRDAGLLSFELGERYAEAARDLMNLAEKDGIAVDLLAVNGHTIAHSPPRGNEPVGMLQVCESSVVAERTGVPVISDFRARDMAAGGQGAPLTAYAHWALFNRDDRTSVVLHLGGMASMTVIPPSLSEVLAFECGPGTIAIDGAVRLLSSGTKEMDVDGKAATKGVVNDEFLEYLLDRPYFSRVPPKSCTREEFGPDTYLRDALASRSEHSFDDLVATCTAAVAYSIIRAFNRFVRTRYKTDRFIVTGGGSRNRALLAHLQKGLTDIKFRTSEEYGMPAEGLAPLAYAILANESLCGTYGNIPSATGARRPVVLGMITPVG